MKPKKKDTGTVLLFALAGFLIITFVLLHVGVIMDTQNITMMDALLQVDKHITANPFDIFPIHWPMLGNGVLWAVLASLYLYSNEESNRHDMAGKEQGSATWTTDMAKYNKTYTEPFGKPTHEGKNNMIMSQNVYLSMDGRKTMRNNNILVIGGAGSGKSRFIVKPNVLQANASFVVTDPSGELLDATGKFLADKGYDIKVFNLVQMQYSCKYNPFAYIRDDNGVVQMINCLIRNTTAKGSSSSGDFWEKSEMMLLQAICFYLVHYCKPEDRNFANVMKMIRLAEVREDQEGYQSVLDIMFEIKKAENKRWYESRNLPVEESIATTQYDAFKIAAGKTLKSILVSVNARLINFNLEQVRELTSSDDMDLMHVGDKPTAIFAIIPSADTTFNYVVSIMYSQLFESLYYHAENECEGKHLKYPVRFLLDEFANIGTIPDFDKKLATMRKYSISCTIILQNLAQIKSMYKDDWETMIGNCDTIVFLGSPELSTQEYISKKLGAATIRVRSSGHSKGKSGSYSMNYSQQKRELMTPEELGTMANNNCIVMVRGEHPFFDTKYKYEGHKDYKYTADADKGNRYAYREMFAQKAAAAAATEQDKVSEEKTELQTGILPPDAIDAPKIIASQNDYVKQTAAGHQTLFEQNTQDAMHELYDTDDDEVLGEGETLYDSNIPPKMDVDMPAGSIFDPDFEFKLDESILTEAPTAFAKISDAR